MSNAGPMGTPSGWYADPADAARLRWWDGAAWTPHTAARPEAVAVPSTEPGASFAPRLPNFGDPVRLPQRRGWTSAELKTHQTKRSSQTLSSWLLATSLLWVGFPAHFLALFVAQSYPLAGGLVAILVIALIVFALARLDRRGLEANSHRAPSEAWAVLLMPVYFILRTVRVGAGGIPVLLGFVAVLCIGFWVAVNQTALLQLVAPQ